MTRPFRKNVGVIGLGIIGRRVADHLRRQGFSVFVWNRSPRAVPSFVGSPAELAQMCNYLQIFVADDDALRQVVRAITPQLTPRHIVIAHPTVSPDTMREAATLVERRGARLVEAPFTGSKLAAEKGQLVYYAAGDDAALREVQPLLQASSKEILYVGEIGAASLLKVATNMVTAASVQAAAEAMALVRRSGVALEKFAEALKNNGSNSATLEMKVPQIISGDFETHFSVKHMLKDMEIANGLAHNFDLDLTVARATRDRLLEEMEQDHGNEDYAAVARKFVPATTSPDQAQPDLFGRGETEMETSGIHEDPAFVEQQLSQLSNGTEPKSDMEAPSAGGVDEPISAPAEQTTEASTGGEPAFSTAEAPIEPAVESPARADPQPVVEAGPEPASPSEPSISQEHAIEEKAARLSEVALSHDDEPEERLGFFARLLKRTTDY